MGSPITPPRLILDASGRVRMKLKRGVGDHHAPEGPHVHYYRTNGARVDSTGRPLEARSRQNFRPIVWDLPESPPPPLPAGPPNVDAAFGVARRSPTFRRLLEETLRAGWGIELAVPAFGSGCRKGPHTVSLDASRRGAFVARMVHDVALAHALAEPLPFVDATTPGFVHDAAMFLMRRGGHAALQQAIVRDEILAGGGPDMGGPGLRGLQLEAYDVSCRQSVPLERVVDAIAFSIDGELAHRFSPELGPRVARNLKEAFVAPTTLVSSGLTAEMLDVLEVLRKLPQMHSHAVSRAFGVELTPRPLLVETPYLDVHAALIASGPFSWVELRAPTRAAPHLAPRLLLVPRFELSHFDLVSWFGLGAPYHVDLGADAVATAVYPFEPRHLYVTYRANEVRSVTSFTVHGA